MPQHKPFVSAGTTPAEEIDPTVVSAMAEVGIGISKARPKLIEQGVVDHADLVITMCCDVHGIKRSDQEWNLPDPKGQSLHQVRKIRKMIKNSVLSLMPLLEQETK